jgi:signal transduction histidine kinase
VTGRPRSLRRRLMLGTGVGVALAFAIAGIVVHALAKRSLYEQLDDSIAQEAHSLSVLVEQDDDEIDSDLSPATLAGTRGRYFELFGPDPEREVLVRAQSLGEHDLAPAAVPGPGLRITSASLPDGTTGRQATLVFYPRQEHGDQTPIPVTLVVARDTAEAADSLARLDVALAIAAAAAVVLCVALLGWITRYGLEPVRDVAQRISAIDPTAPRIELDARGVPVELAPIVDRLSDLMHRLAAVVARERELTAEVAHELRTPLAGMRSTIELALSRDREPDRYRAALAECLAIVEQTHRMVEALLALAKLDAGTVTATSAPVPLAPIVDDVVALVDARAIARGLAIERPPGDATALTDPDRIRVVLQNLVDNAVGHADAGGRVRIGVVTAGDRAIVRIANTGCRIGPDAIGRVFERFWRGDAARTAGEHAGLGLALCKKLVDLVGGVITVTAEVGGEFAVTVELPAAAAEGAARSG